MAERSSAEIYVDILALMAERDQVLQREWGEDIDNQIALRFKCEQSLRRIISMAGAPDAADACRNIIKEASECLDQKAGDV